METVLTHQPELDVLTSEEVSLAAPKIMKYVKEGEKSELPELLIIMGPLAAGKSTYIRDKFSSGYVWLDMARIFFDLQSETGIKLNRKLELINFVGLVTLDLAILEKRNIVIEMTGDDLEKIDDLIEMMKPHGYTTKIIVLNSLEDSCFGTKENGTGYMSSYYTENFHFDWFNRTAAGL